MSLLLAVCRSFVAAVVLGLLIKNDSHNIADLVVALSSEEEIVTSSSIDRACCGGRRWHRNLHDGRKFRVSQFGLVRGAGH